MLCDQLVARVEKSFYFTGLFIGPNSLLKLENRMPEKNRIEKHRGDWFLRLHASICILKALPNKSRSLASLIGLQYPGCMGEQVLQEIEFLKHLETSNRMP